MSTPVNNLKPLVPLLLIALTNLASAELIVDIYDKLIFTMQDLYTNETKTVYESDELYSFPWNTNVRYLFVLDYYCM